MTILLRHLRYGGVALLLAAQACNDEIPLGPEHTAVVLEVSGRVTQKTLFQGPPPTDVSVGEQVLIEVSYVPAHVKSPSGTRTSGTYRLLKSERDYVRLTTRDAEFLAPLSQVIVQDEHPLGMDRIAFSATDLSLDLRDTTAPTDMLQSSTLPVHPVDLKTGVDSGHGWYVPGNGFQLGFDVESVEVISR